jgi:hypothetical protein
MRVNQASWRVAHIKVIYTASAIYLRQPEYESRQRSADYGPVASGSATASKAAT